MATKRAKIIEPDQLRGVLAFIEARSPTKEADTVMVQLSHRAGLRVSEIANLPVRAALTSRGEISKTITVFASVAKYGRERSIPMHPQLAAAIRAFLKRHPHAEFFALSRYRQHQTVNALTVWFHRLYNRLGLHGCSSHSGRRTFLTQLARRAGRAGCSLRDVQMLAGHARLDTTERYLEPSPHVASLVATLGDARFDDMDSENFAEPVIHPLIAEQMAKPRAKRASRRPRVADFKLPTQRGRKGAKQ